MTNEREQLKNWVETWKKTGAELEKLRIEKIKKSDTT
ncbi:hypothetical protein BH18ACI1_BH18ACI1_08900 [soil metagenome]|jgi:hypothetical protein